MSQEKSDLRVKRTRKLIQDALVDLIQEKSFDTITIGDITERAMVNRATFYRHFEDKYQLVMSIFEETFEQMLAAAGPPTENLGGISIDPENPPDGWVKLFEHFAENASLYRALLGGDGSALFAARLGDYLKQVVGGRLHLIQESEQLPMPEEVVFALVSNLLVGLLRWWLQSGNRYTPKQMAGWFLYFIIYGYLPSVGLYDKLAK